MIIRLALAALLVLGLGTSAYYTQNAPANRPNPPCCGLDPF